MYIDDTDYEKKQEYTLHHRALIIDEVIKEAGIEGVFQLSRLSKFSGSVAEALVKRDKDRYANDVYNEFAKDSLPEQFVRSYFLHLYFLIGSDAYLNICDALHTVSKDHIAMVLYAPEYRRELADMAESIGGEVLVEYWKKVTLWKLAEDEVPLIQMRLKSVGRYEDILNLMTHGSVAGSFSQEDKVTLLIEMFRKGLLENMIRNAYRIAMSLKTIDLPTEKDLRDGLLQIEFLMYNHLCRYLHGESLHFVKEVKSSPELMIELVELQYLPDEEFRNEDDSNDNNQSIQLKINVSSMNYNHL